MSDQPSPEKKIIIDEDWKSRVEAEKDQLRQHEEQTTPPGAESKEVKWPKPSLSLLATTLAAQAMIALGAAPNPLSGKQQTDLPQAKHFIDTIAMLVEKTEGNRQPEESALLDSLLHELRMGYVAMQGGTQP